MAEAKNVFVRMELDNAQLLRGIASSQKAFRNLVKGVNADVAASADAAQRIVADAVKKVEALRQAVSRPFTAPATTTPEKRQPRTEQGEPLSPKAPKAPTEPKAPAQPKTDFNPRYESSLQSVGRTLGAVNAQLNQQAQALRGTGNVTAQVERMIAQLQTRYDGLAKKIQASNFRFQESGKASAAQVAALRAVEAELNKLPAQYDKLRAKLAQPVKINLSSPQVREAGESIQQAGYALDAFISGPLRRLAGASTTQAKELDTYRTRFTALEGDIGRANQRLTQLQQLSQQSVGVTFKAAADASSQLQAISGIGKNTIDGLIKSVGKLNAAFTIDDQAGFFRNLTQIFNQGFERSDIKEAIGRVPIFEQLLREAVPGAQNAEALRKLKESGELTLDSFLAGMAEAVNKNQTLAKIEPSITSRFEKLRERVDIAIAPLGRTILDIIEPIVNRLVPIIERIAAGFDSLPKPVQYAAIAFGGLAASLGVITQGIGGFLQLFQLALIPSLLKGATAGTAAAGLFSSIGAAISGLAIPVGIAIAAAVALYAAWKTNFGNIQGLTAQVVNFVVQQWERFKGFWASIAPLVQKAVQSFTSATRPLFEAWSRIVGNNLQQIVNYLTIVLPQAFSILGKIIKTGLQFLTGDFRGAAKTIIAINQGVVDLLKNILQAGIVSLVNIVKGYFRELVGLTGIASASGNLLANSWTQAFMGAIRAMFPNVAKAVDYLFGLLSNAQKNVANQLAQAPTPRAANDPRNKVAGKPGANLDEQFNAFGKAVDAEYKKTAPPSKTTSGKAGGSKGDPAAERLRAEIDALQIERDRIERLATDDAAKYERLLNEQLISEAEYAQRTIQIQTNLLTQKLALLQRERELTARDKSLNPAERNTAFLKLEEQAAQLKQEAEQRRLDLESQQRVKNFQRTVELERQQREFQAQLQTIEDNAEIARLQALGDRKVLTEAETVRRINEIKRNAAQAELDALNTQLPLNADEAQKLANEKALKQAELEALLNEQSVALRTARQRDLQTEREFQAQLKQVRDNAAADDIAREIRRRERLNQERGVNPRFDTELRSLKKQQVNQQLEGELAEIEARTREQIAEINNQLGAIGEVPPELQEATRQRLENRRALILQEQQTLIDNLRANAGEAIAEIQGGLVEQIFDGLSNSIDQLTTKAFGAFSNLATGINAVTKTALGGLLNGLGAVIGRFVQTGKTGSGVFKQLGLAVLDYAKQQLIAFAVEKAIFAAKKGFIAIQAVLDGLRESALAAGAAAIGNFAGAALHTTSAAGHYATAAAAGTAALKAGAQAGIATLGAAALGAITNREDRNNAVQNTGASGQGASFNASNDPRVINRPIEVNLVIDSRTDAGVIQKIALDGVLSNSRFRNVTIGAIDNVASYVR